MPAEGRCSAATDIPHLAADTNHTIMSGYAEAGNSNHVQPSWGTDPFGQAARRVRNSLWSESSAAIRRQPCPISAVP